MAFSDEELIEEIGRDFRNPRKILSKHRNFLVAYECIRRFLFSDYYIILIALISYICWLTKAIKTGLVLHLLIFGVLLFVSRDLTPCMAVFFYGPFCISSYKEEDLPNLLKCLGAIVLPVAGIVFHFWFYRVSPFPTLMSYAQVFVSVAILLGGLFCMTIEKFERSFAFLILFGPLALISDLFMSWYINTSKTIDIAKYFAKILMWMGVFLGIYTFSLFFKSGVPFIDFIQTKAYLDYGFGNGNNISTLQLFSIPMCFYLTTRYKWGIIYLIPTFFTYLTIIMTQSRGSILACAILFFFNIVSSVYYSPFKKWLAIAWALGLVVVIIFVVIFLDPLMELFKGIFKNGLDDNNRTPLYDEAMELFFKYPIFGVGLGYEGTKTSSPVGIYFFHSTFFQILANYGIFGFCAYVYHYVNEIRVVLRRWKSSFNIFGLYSALGYEMYSMIDTGTFCIPMVFVNLLLFSVMESCNKDGKDHIGIANKQNRFFAGKCML